MSGEALIGAGAAIFGSGALYLSGSRGIFGCEK
jgi:hypothetical protein